MNYIFITGLIGSLLLVTGSAWPQNEDATRPAKSIKNWLFFIGGLFMLLYAVLGYLLGGLVFFVILEILGAVAGILMMLGTPEKLNIPVISVSGVALIIWSLFLFNGYATLVFILGLCIVSLGFTFRMGTLRRNVALAVGSILIALFSYLGASWIFFWLNVFFTIFSGWYVYKGLVPKQENTLEV
ncbi:MAG: hypothetical protein WC045_04125 [Patescibacteria group bacterium]